MIIIVRKFENLNFIKKIAQTGVTTILVTIPLTLETMQYLIFKHWRGRRAPGARQKLKKLKTFKKH